MLASLEDRQLVQRCLERQPGAWDTFLERFLPLFHHTARKTAHLAGKACQPEDVEDCLAEILLEILSGNFRCLKLFQGESSLATFLLVLARRRASRFWLERKSVPVPIPDADRQTGGVVSGEDQGEASVEWGERLGSLLMQLPLTEREAVRLHHLEGYSYSEVASQLRIPVNSVGPLLTKARKRLNRAAQRA